MSLNCHELTNLSNDYLSGDLGFLSRLKLRLHLMLCHYCRRFLRHSHISHQYVLKQQQRHYLIDVDLNESELDDVMDKIKQNS